MSDLAVSESIALGGMAGTGVLVSQGRLCHRLCGRISDQSFDIQIRKVNFVAVGASLPDGVMNR